MRRFGLIGSSLSHSFSKDYFNNKFKKENLDCSYGLFELEKIEDLKTLLVQSDLSGFNITIPYKKQVLTFADELSAEVKEIGAANTFKRLPNNTWKAFNTDITGFKESLLPILNNRKRALILGTGGASKAVSYVLRQLKVDFSFVSRQPKDQLTYSYDDLKGLNIDDFPLIINTTPVGTFPETADFPSIPYANLNPNHLLYDLVYNPTETSFLKKGKVAGASIKNGLEMLHLQAQKAWDIWNEPI